MLSEEEKLKRIRETSNVRKRKTVNRAARVLLLEEEICEKKREGIS